MLKMILFGAVGVIGVILVLATIKPSQVTISRELTIHSSPQELFPYINNAKKSYEWMPWSENDPSVEVKFSGPDSGLGSSSSWVGSKMGVGTSEIIESIENISVKTHLKYSKPNEMNQIAEVTLTPTTDGTLVRWKVEGHNSFFFRILCVFIDFDKLVGDQFLQGLNKLKKIVEKE